MITPITVLMPVFNAEKFIKEAIDSVLTQTFTDFELLIINDGSTDSTVQIINSFSDSRIKLIHQKNGGVSAALNTGLLAATGKYIARFDADDVCYPERLKLQYDFIIAHPDYILVGSDANYITEEGEFIFTFHNPGYTHDEIIQTIEKHCSFIHSTVLYNKNAVLEIGGYEIKAHTFEDYFLWKRLIKKGKVSNLKLPLIKVRFNPASVTIDEKDYHTLFLKLKQKALETGFISEEEGSQIFKSIKSLSKTEKESSYNRMLGKKFLWDNYNPTKARNYILKSIKLKPFILKSYFLLFFSFFPNSLIMSIYQIKKKISALKKIF